MTVTGEGRNLENKPVVLLHRPQRRDWGRGRNSDAECERLRARPTAKSRICEDYTSRHTSHLNMRPKIQSEAPSPSPPLLAVGY